MAKSIYGALALVALSGCPSPQCPDGSAMVEGRCSDSDTGSDIDASVRGDANTDAFSIFDAWMPDAPPDAYVIPDAGSDGGICSRCPVGTPACLDGTSCVQCTAADTRACTGATPACDGTTNTCVACVDDSTCSGAAAPACDIATHTCVACVDSSTCTAALGGPVCDVPRNTCVGCLDAMTCLGNLDACVAQTCVGCDDRVDCMDDIGLPACVGNTCRQCDRNTDCGAAAASRCNTTTNLCTGCTADTDCMHLSATPACDEGTGTCVPCMPDNESLCGANSCNPMTRTCTTTPRAMTRACNRCIADSECAAGLSCTEAVTGGFYCFPNRPGTGCAAPYIVSRSSVPTASGAVASVCRLRAATCEALLDFSNQSIDGADQCGSGGMSDAACGASGTADGYCRRIGDDVGGAFRCTYRCTSGDDCESGVSCNDFGTDAPDTNRYCAI